MDEQKHVVGIFVDHPIFCLVGLSMILSAAVQAVEIIMEPITMTVDRKTRQKYCAKDKKTK